MLVPLHRIRAIVRKLSIESTMQGRDQTRIACLKRYLCYLRKVLVFHRCFSELSVPPSRFVAKKTRQ